MVQQVTAVKVTGVKLTGSCLRATILWRLKIYKKKSKQLPGKDKQENKNGFHKKKLNPCANSSIVWVVLNHFY